MAAKSGSSLSGTDTLFSGSFDVSVYKDRIDNLALTLSVMASRMATSETRVDGKPQFVSHLYHENGGELKSLQEEWSKTIGRESLLMALEFHWIHTAAVTLDRLGMRSNNWERRSRYTKDYLEWATALHIHEFGILSDRLGSSLAECTEAQDPLTDCGLDANGILSDILDVCTVVDCAETVYDYPVSETHLEEFLETLQWSYPYTKVENQKLDWEIIYNVSKEAFNILSTNRAAKDPSFAITQTRMMVVFLSLLCSM